MRFTDFEEMENPVASVLWTEALQKMMIDLGTAVQGHRGSFSRTSLDPGGQRLSVQLQGFWLDHGLKVSWLAAR